MGLEVEAIIESQLITRENKGIKEKGHWELKNSFQHLKVISIIYKLD